MSALDVLDDWPVPAAAAAVVGTVRRAGQPRRYRRRFALASVTKPLAARAAQVAIEEGAVALDTEAGPPGSTVRHLLAHTAGYEMTSAKVMAKPGTRRIYSNHGFAVLAEVLERETSIEFDAYLAESVLEPLGMADTALDGGAAAAGYGVTSTVDRPGARSPATCCCLATVSDADARRRHERAVPRAGRGASRLRRATAQRLGPGVRDARRQIPALDGSAPTRPARTAISASRARSSGSIRTPRLALVVLTNRDFGDWAHPLWPALSDEVLREFGAD